MTVLSILLIIIIAGHLQEDLKKYSTTVLFTVLSIILSMILIVILSYLVSITILRIVRIILLPV